MARSIQTRLEKLTFSGNENDWEYFAEQFEARIVLLNLKKTLKGTDVPGSSENETNVNDRKEQLWCELIQCLDRKSLMLIKRDKPDGSAAWNRLQSYFKSTERPHVQRMLNEISNLKLEASESIKDYILRSENLQMNLQEAGEGISEKMMIAMLLKGLPKEFDNFTTVVNFSKDAKSLDEIKRDLSNFAETSKTFLQKNSTNETFFSNKTIKCYSCGKQGHRKQDCKKDIKCYNCNQMGHFARDCRKNTQNNHSNSSHQKQFTSKNQQNKSHFTSENENTVDFFSFHSNDNDFGVNSDKFCLIDSGCSAHMFKTREFFTELDTNINGNVGCANGSNSKIVGKGKVTFKVQTSDGRLITIELKDTLFVPTYTANLVSVSKLTRNKADVMFDDVCPRIILPDSSEILLQNQRDLFKMKIELANEHSVENVAMVVSDIEIWHKRLGHNNFDDIKKLENLTEGVKFSQKKHNNCVDCQTEKAKRKAIPKVWGTRATEKLEIVHTDILGPIDTISVDNFKYAIGFIDSYTRFSAVYLLKNKSDSTQMLKQFIADYGKPKTIASDNPKEFKFGKFKQFCLDNAIRTEFSAPYTPEENGKIERTWGSVMAITRCLLQTASMEKKFWSFALKTAFYLKNRVYHSAIGVTPYEKFFQSKPDLKHVKFFGCAAYMFVEKVNMEKLDSRAVKGFLLGYSLNSKCYIVGTELDGNFEFLESRNVTFDEKVFPFKNDDENDSGRELEISVENYSEISEKNSADNVNGGNLENDQLRRSERIKQLNAPEISFFRNETIFDECWLADATFYVDNLPKNANDALSNPNWKKAMQDEYNSLINNNVWELVPQTDQTILGGRWHFTLKYNNEGVISRYKARYVAKGYNQIKGVDFKETFCPTVKMATLRLILAISTAKGFDVRQWDVKTAYLNANLEENVFLQQPEGFEQKDSGGNQLVCKLNKSIYGLKQSGRNWYYTLQMFLKSIDFTASKSDPCLFMRISKDVLEYVCIWVDDIIYACNDANKFISFEQQISSQFKISETAKLYWFLGMKFNFCGDGLEISQEAYIDKLLSKFGLIECKPVSTPAADGLKLCKRLPNEVKLANDKDYRGLIGSLSYLSITTRPDISFIAHCLSRYVNDPTEVHWIAAKRVLRYLKGTRSYKLIYRRCTATPILYGYSDSDWGGDSDTRRSTSGYCFFLFENSGAISWASKLQTTVAKSTAESEATALSLACNEGLFLLNLLIEIKLDLIDFKMFVDNQACISLVKNDVNKGVVKHFAIHLHFIRDLIQKKQLDLNYIGTDNMVADILTKNLGKTKCKRFGLQMFAN